MDVIEGRANTYKPKSCSFSECVQDQLAIAASHGNFYTLSDLAFQTCFDKNKTGQLARRLGINVAEERLISSSAEVDDFEMKWHPPAVVKPVSSVDLLAPGSRRQVVKVYDLDELGHVLKNMVRDGPVLVQENFPGRGVGVEVLARNGRVLAAFQHARVHEPVHGGGSSYRKSVPLRPELVRAASALAEAIALTGVAMFEFRVNDERNDWILIEINGRFWGSLPLAVSAGMDFPLYLVEMLLDGRIEFPQTYRTELYARSLSWDLPWFIHNLRADKRNKSLQVLSLRQILAETGNILRSSERIDTLTLDDPKPFFRELLSIASRGRSALTSRAWRSVKTRVGTLNPMRRLGKHRRTERALALFRSARHVTFVCKGNICRSPFAERLGRSVLPRSIATSSAGFYPRTGRPSPDEACVAAAEWGVDLSEHRSRVLERDLVEAADVLVIFDDENYDAMREAFPDAMGRVVRASDLLPGHPLDVPDPWGQSKQQFEVCYRTISAALTVAAEACSGAPSSKPAAAAGALPGRGVQ